MNAHQRIDAADRISDLLSVAEAARFLRISQSTLWRWIGRGEVPAYRIGPKRVWLKKTELDSVTTRAEAPKRGAPKDSSATRAAERLLTDEELQRWLAAIEAGEPIPFGATHGKRRKAL